MKIPKLHFIILISTWGAISAISAQNQPPQKYNLDFNNFDPENQIFPKGWFKWGDFKTVKGELLENTNYVGKVVSDDKGKFGVITYRIPANYVGDTITLAGYIKHENVKNGFVGLLMRIDGHNRMLAMENMFHNKIKGTKDWKEYSIKLPYPPEAESIYIGGILSGKGTAWFDDFKITIDGKDIQTLDETSKSYLKDFDAEKLKSAIGKSSVPIDLSNRDSIISGLDPLLNLLGNKKIVAIGESTHGTAEFYQFREIITKKLIREKGFNTVVLESPYDDIELLNKGLSSNPLDSLIKKHLFSIYQTKEVKSFLEWYKDNRENNNVLFKGCDDSQWVFAELLETQIEKNKDEKLILLLNKLKANITLSSKSNLKKEDKIGLDIYNNILAIEEYLGSTGGLTDSVKEILFNGKNTFVNYLNIDNGNPNQSRDEIMADRISYLAKDKNVKIIVWAHNAHISKNVIIKNEIGIMGRDLKHEFGDEYHSIGLTTLKGGYSYIEEKFINGDHSYNDILKKAEIKSPESPTWENTFALNKKALWIDMKVLKKELKRDDILGVTKLIGYPKETKEDTYLLPLLRIFDSLIFIENTSATTPLFNLEKE